MATHPGPRPKRKDYATKIGYELALGGWESLMNVYRYDKERERQAEQERRNTERRERARQQGVIPARLAILVKRINQKTTLIFTLIKWLLI